jgi:hypothetical protein
VDVAPKNGLFTVCLLSDLVDVMVPFQCLVDVDPKLFG